jgi:hypothetical protein
VEAQLSPTAQLAHQSEIIATQRDKAMQRLSDPLSGISARRPGNRRQAFVYKRLSTEE